MSIVHTNRRTARAAVIACQPFKGSNVYGRKLGDRGFGVFSYGEHFPMYVFDGAVWHRNTSRYSPSTSQHQGFCAPLTYTNLAYVEHDTAGLRDLVRSLEERTPRGWGVIEA